MSPLNDALTSKTTVSPLTSNVSGSKSKIAALFSQAFELVCKKVHCVPEIDLFPDMETDISKSVITVMKKKGK